MPYKRRFIKSILPLFFLISAVSFFANSAFPEELYKIFVNDFSKGMNSYDISHVIPANSGTIVRNAVISRKGRISKRNGVGLFAQDIGNSAFTGIGRFTPIVTNDYLVVVDHTGALHRSTSSASWYVVNPTDLLTAGKDAELIQCNDVLAILNRTDYPAWYDGTNFNKGLTGSASPPIAKYGAWFKNYLFLAYGETETDWVWFSSNLEPKTFDVGNDIFKVNTGDGQAITGLRPFKENELVIYKERSTWLLDITGTIPLDDWTLKPVLEDVGCIAPRSIANVGNDQWFLSNEPIGVRSLVRTAYDKIHTSLISTPIQDIFDGTASNPINKTHINKAAAIVFDNKYLLAIPTGTSTINDEVWIYDLITSAWYQITQWYVADWEIFDNNLYYIDATDGRVLRAFYGRQDQASGPVVTQDSLASPTAKGIPFHYESKSYDFDSPELYKLPDSLEVICESSGDYDLDVYINLDDGGWQSIGSMNLAGESTTLPQDLPFTLSSEKLARKMFHLQQYGEFKEVQIGFHQDASNETAEIRSYTPFATKRKFRRE